MSTLLGWIIFIVAISVSVILHEFGHFATAKAFKMKATQFFMGFGPTLWSFRKGETEYGIKAIPAGGFVKITGMTSMDEVDPEDEPRSFRRHPAWQRIIVLVAGSTMHFLLAMILLLAIPLGIGLQRLDPSSTIGTVVNCVPKTDQSGCVKGEPDSPAAQLGLKPGDKITGLAGRPVHTWAQFTTEIGQVKLGSRVAVTVQQDGREFTKTVQLAQTRQVGSNGKPGKSVAFLGVSQGAVFQTTGVGKAFSWAGSMFSQAVTGTASVVSTLPSAFSFSHLFGADRGQTAAGQVTSIVGVGEITSDVVASAGGWQAKVYLVLLIVVSVNIFIGLLNLVPLLPLDGGHVAIVLYEKVRDLVARMRGRPAPGLVDITKLIPVSLGVFAVIIGFSLLLVVADIVNPINLG
ncbi:MAG TPA: site-2 protease family protein [Streptosporangiaceae bacterium]|jgi:membrane-associated protease RseP (regulator of RpoE activity)